MLQSDWILVTFLNPNSILSLALPCGHGLIRFFPDKGRHVEIVDTLVGTGWKFFR